jgi:hypothetical protein
MKKIQILTVLVLTLSASALFGLETKEPTLMDALNNLFGGTATTETKPAPTTQPAQPGLWDVLKGALGNTSPVEKAQEYAQQARTLEQQKSTFSEKIDELKKLPGGETLMSYFQPFLDKLNAKTESAQLEATKLAPSAEGLQQLQAKAAALQAQKVALDRQIAQTQTSSSSDWVSLLFAQVLKLAQGGVSGLLATLQPVIDQVKSAVAKQGLNAIGGAMGL